MEGGTKTRNKRFESLHPKQKIEAKSLFYGSDRRYSVCFDVHLWRKNMGKYRGQMIYVRGPGKGSGEMMAK